MPLPLIIGGAAAAVGAAIASKAFKKPKTSTVSYYIKNNRSMYFDGMVEKRFLFVKYLKPEWVTHWDNAYSFDSEDEANDCINQNRFRKVEIVEK